MAQTFLNLLLGELCIILMPRNKRMTNESVASLDSVAEPGASPTVLQARHLSVYYGNFRAVYDVNLDIRRNTITALIGPSGCGKSTLLRAFNRMNDLISDARYEGEVRFHDMNLYDRSIDPVSIRRRIGMVFQEYNLVERLSVMENLLCGRLGYVPLWRAWLRRYPAEDIARVFAPVGSAPA